MVKAGPGLSTFQQKEGITVEVKAAIREFSKKAPFAKGTQCRHIVIAVALKHELIFFHFTDEYQSDIFLFINKSPCADQIC